jgi:hypothetical protein
VIYNLHGEFLKGTEIDLEMIENFLVKNYNPKTLLYMIYENVEDKNKKSK